ncbi:hypothetical protein [Janthinobacterium sp. JC611]|uniref:hypothetical protein n=1 Tax=Janthinobacterium sp. JC611 TaxID=2816201 RepID=UPI001BFDC6DD|nr:hypothetical protein [Janthinobacterium sp. JC611]
MVEGRDAIWGAGLAMAAWGALNAAIPVAWFTWLSREMRAAPESAGDLIVAAIQLAIMPGATLGGLLLDRYAITATFPAGAAPLALGALPIGKGERLRAPSP